jgi:molecular chaperone GrpE
MADEPLIDPAGGSPAATEPRGPQESRSESESPEIAALRRERDDNYDRLLRKTAEFDNYRKRIERERREQADESVIKLLEELLLVVDDFDRALTIESDESAAGYRRGVELIHTKLHDLLRKQGVRPIVAIGSDFDPNLHQAVVHESSPDHREGEVIDELRRGYMLGDRLLRAAMVKVAKP